MSASICDSRFTVGSLSDAVRVQDWAQRCAGVGRAAIEKCLQLGREKDVSILRCIVERLLAEPIACQGGGIAFAVIDREGEHAGHALAPFAEPAQHDLGVGPGLERMAAADELGTQGLEVVDLTVVDDPTTLVIGHRHVAGRTEIDDA
jgi:hypothetical protein